MAATLNLYLKATIILDGKLLEIGDLYAPYTTATTADIKDIKTVSVANTTYTEILSVGSGADIASAVAFVIIPAGAGTLIVKGADDADTCALNCVANFPVIIPSGTIKADAATPALRAVAANSTISSIGYYQATGGAIKVQVFAVG